MTSISKEQFEIDHITIRNLKKHAYNMRQLVHNSKKRISVGASVPRAYFIKEQELVTKFIGRL